MTATIPSSGDNTPPAHVADAAQLADQETRITHRLARLVLAAFLFTFIIARLLVILIMAGKLPPELFFHVKGTHVHHLNYGIILLSCSGAYLIFSRPSGWKLSVASVFYGIGLGLTFDEFGMWLHLGGPYWQRASYDAVVVISAALSLLAFGSTLRKWRARHHIAAALVILGLGIFGIALYQSLQQWANRDLEPRLEQLEAHGPT